MNNSIKKNKKPLLIYFHRYPIEFEIIQYPGLKDLINELLKKYSIIYFSMKGISPPDYKLRKNIKIKEISLKINTKNSYDKWIKTFYYYLLLPFTLFRIKKLKPSFIICKETLPFIPSVIGKLNIPMIIDTSDWWWSILFGNKKLGKILAQKMEKIEVNQWKNFNATIISHSNAEGKLVEQKGMPKDRIKIVNAPLFKGMYFPYNADKERKKLNLAKKDWVVALHGIIHPSKGYDQILDWWKILIKDHPNWKLLIIGGAGGENWCRNKIKNLNLRKNAIMTGWLPNQKEVNKYLNAADCLLVTRRNTAENKGIIPSALYHSLEVGKPTLITGLPGMSEIVNHKVDGYVFEPDNYNSFKSVLGEIYRNPQKAREVGKQGIKRAEECFDPVLAAKKWAQIIDNSIITSNN